MTNDCPCSDCGEKMEWESLEWPGDKIQKCPMCGKNEKHTHTDKKEWDEFLKKQEEKRR